MPMNEPSWRKPAGIGLILLLIIVWAVIVVSVAGLLAGLLAGLPWPVHALYYTIAGIIWILPLKPLLRWMETGTWRD